MSSFSQDYRFRCVCRQGDPPDRCRCWVEQEVPTVPTISIRESTHMGKTLYNALTRPPNPPYGLFSGTVLGQLYSLTAYVGEGNEGIVYSVASRANGAELIAKVRRYEAADEVVNTVSECFLCCYGDQLRVNGISPHFVAFYDLYVLPKASFRQDPFFRSDERLGSKLDDFPSTVSVTIMSRVGEEWKAHYRDGAYMVPATVFELVWALYSMKVVCHVLPCDLHLGNICVASQASTLTREYVLGSHVFHCSERHPMPVLIDYGLYRFRFKASKIPSLDYEGTELAPLKQWDEHLESTLDFVLSRLRHRDREAMRTALDEAFRPGPFDISRWAHRHFASLRVAKPTQKTVWQLPNASIQDCFGRIVAPLSVSILTEWRAAYLDAIRLVSKLRSKAARDPGLKAELAAVQEAIQSAKAMKAEAQRLVRQEQSERMQGKDTNALRAQIPTQVEDGLALLRGQTK